MEEIFILTVFFVRLKKIIVWIGTIADFKDLNNSEWVKNVAMPV